MANLMKPLTLSALVVTRALAQSADGEDCSCWIDVTLCLDDNPDIQLGSLCSYPMYAIVGTIIILLLTLTCCVIDHFIWKPIDIEEKTESANEENKTKEQKDEAKAKKQKKKFQSLPSMMT